MLGDAELIERCESGESDRVELTSGNVPFDMQGVSGATVETDLDMRAFEHDYLPCAVSPDMLAENRREGEEQLRALRLVARNGAPTVTAILVLGTDPRYWFPGAYMQFVRYDGTAVTDGIVDHAELSGPLPEQVRDADRLLRLNISRALDTRGERHVEQRSYPYEALRELLRNAVVHRNYENSNTPVGVADLSRWDRTRGPGTARAGHTRSSSGTSRAVARLLSAFTDPGFTPRSMAER